MGDTNKGRGRAGRGLSGKGSGISFSFDFVGMILDDYLWLAHILLQKVIQFETSVLNKVLP